MATVNFGRRGPLVDTAPFDPLTPSPLQPGPVQVQPWTDPPLTKLPQTRTNPTAPTVQAYATPSYGYGDTPALDPNGNPKPYNPTDPHPVLTPPPAGGWGVPPPVGTSGPGGVDLNTGQPVTAPAPASASALQTAFQTATQGLVANERDQQSLQALADRLTAAGYPTTIAQTDPQGRNQGLIINSQLHRVIDSSGNWVLIPDVNGSAWGSGDGTSTSTGTDQSSELYLNELLSRIMALRKPVNDPMAPLYQLMALQRIQGLNGAPFTGGQDAALVAQYMNPLTQARDASLQANKERIGARGMLPTSGLLDELNKGTTTNYQTGVAYGANNLAVRAVNERQARQQEQLSILSDLLTQGKAARTEEDQRGAQIVDLASQLPQMDAQRLQLLLQASGDSTAASSAASSLSDQNLQALRQRILDANTQADRDEALGEAFAFLIANAGTLFK